MSRTTTIASTVILNNDKQTIVRPSQGRRQKSITLFGVSQLLSIWSLVPSLEAFSPCIPNTLPVSTKSISALHAKSVKSKGNRKGGGGGSGGGGFGTKEKASSSRLSKSSPEPELFPPLDERALSTLVPSSDASKEFLSLSPEIHDRLKQIYGFSDFNLAHDCLFNDITENDESTSDSASTLSSLIRLDDDEENNLNGIHDTQQTPRISRKILSCIPASSRFRVLHVDPMVLSIPNFLTDEECDAMVAMSISSSTKADQKSLRSRSRTVGKDASARAQRTSTTWFHPYSECPALLAKACRLLGLDSVANFEEVQTVRYRPSEHFTWHLDALPPKAQHEADYIGHQRTATLLVYLATLDDGNHNAVGGATVFRDLGPLRVEPVKGTALLFFPAAGGVPGTPFDGRTVHAGEAVSSACKPDQQKWLAQLWLRNGPYRPAVPLQNNDPNSPDVVDALHQYCHSLSSSQLDSSS